MEILEHVHITSALVTSQLRIQKGLNRIEVMDRLLAAL
jgi:hypothetical protein